MNIWIKKFFLKKKSLMNQKNLGLKKYPQSFDKIALFCKSKKMPDANLISKLESAFGNQVQILIFVFLDKNQDDNVICINYKNFDWFGNLKSISVKDELKALDMVIDMTQQYSTVKNYALSLASQAYKIALGHYAENVYHLSFDFKKDNQELFADEIIKYHSILSHAKS